ncbi:FIST C-terminal domain-containing protein [bacterium]|nr:FIST C-terminal domain-containing protein [bacterium]MBU1958513.1 FIST C-terminal domain-containing protein [bacterium]
MITETLTYDKQWKYKNEQKIPFDKANIVFIFGEREALKQPNAYEEIRRLYPGADIVGCSSSGNILDGQINDAAIVATAVQLEQGYVNITTKDFDLKDDLKKISYDLVSELPKDGLKHVFLLSDGLNMNGSSLAEGANEAMNHDLPITGGLAGDGTDFQETLIIANDFAKQHRLVAVGFYGEKLAVSSGCYAGWDEFGITRRITKSEGNTVYEIDNKPALDLYKKYLGEYARELPQSGLQFPFKITKDVDSKSNSLIRTVLAVDEARNAVIFAGDVPQGSYVKLMKTNIDGLIEGSQKAASKINQVNDNDALGLVVSCLGRRLVLKQLTDDELEAISDTLGENVQLTGFYSYGEVAPYSDELVSCRLHNQTMTLTVIYEEKD